MYETLRALKDSGVSLIPIKAGEKMPALAAWKEYQQRRPSDDELAAWAADYANFGMVCGKVSGNLEIIDFDDYHKPHTFEAWQARLSVPALTALSNLPIVKTRSGGYHVRYRCETIEGNQKLYSDFDPTIGKDATIIETRGEGGQALIPPSDGYTLIQGSLTSIPSISVRIRDEFFTAARSFNPVPDQPAATPASKPTQPVAPSERPGDVFMRETTWPQILEPLGWKKLFTHGVEDYWQRPGKKGHGVSATTNYKGSDSLHTFSTNVPEPLVHDASYTKFAVYTLFNHGGDYGAAARALAEKYNLPPQEKKKVIPTDAGPLDLGLLTSTKKLANGTTKVTFPQNVENMIRILTRHPEFEGRFRFDDFTQTYEIKSPEWRQLEDVDTTTVQTRISILFEEFRMVGRLIVQEAILKTCKQNTIDSAGDYIRNIVWDGNPRVDQWLQTTYGTPDDEYHRAVGSNWLKGLVRRVIEPGCKFDYVLVVEGPQGTKKSTSLSVLGGDWHVETVLDTSNKDFFMQFLGNIIVEFSEGESLSRTEVKRMKAVITMQTDKYRPPYERSTKAFPRRCVFAMTTNQDEYLKDETGNRRWFPVRIALPEADIDWLKANRDQLFAEAYHRVINLRETTYEFPIEAAEAMQRARLIHDPNEDAVIEWYESLSEAEKDAGITVLQGISHALHKGFHTGGITRMEEMSMAGIYKNVLRLEKRRTMNGGDRAMRWFAKGTAISDTSDVPITSPLDSF